MIKKKYLRALAGGALMLGAGAAQAGITFEYLVPPASQIAGPYSHWHPPKSSGWAITNSSTATGTSSGVNFSTQGGVAARSTGSAVATKIPSVVTTTATRAAIASGAAKAFTAARTLAGPVGVAVTGWQIYTAYKNSGLKTCPPPDFFCGPDVQTVDTTQTGWIYKDHWTGVEISRGTVLDPRPHMKAEIQKRAAGDYYVASTSYTTTGPLAYKEFFTTWKTDLPLGQPTYTIRLSREVASQYTTTPGPALTESEMTTQGQTYIGGDSGSRSKAYFDAIADANNKAAGAGRAIPVTADSLFPSTAVTTISASPVNLPVNTVSTTNFTDANGVPQTRTVTEQATIQPTIQAGTGGNTTVVHNVTNIITTTTTTNNYADGTSGPDKVDTVEEKITPILPPPPIEIPNDYNKEVTQQAVLDELRSDAAPNMPDQVPRVDTAVADADAKLAAARDAIEQNQEAERGFFYEFLWTPPVGSCVATPARLSTGAVVLWDICPTVLNIRDVLGWLFAIFTGWTVYMTLFKRGD